MIKKETDIVIVPITISVGMRRFAKEQSKKIPGCPRPDVGSISHFLNHVAKEYATKTFNGKIVEGINDIRVNSNVHSTKKERAERKLNYELSMGRMTIPSVCSECGVAPRAGTLGRRRLFAHHENYDKPLDVKWMCTYCHSKLHKNNGI